MSDIPQPEVNADGARPSFLRRARIPALIYVICLAAYLGASGGRLKRHSDDNHYVYLANDLLHGRLKLAGLGNSDAHRVETLGCCFTEFGATIRDMSDLVEAIRARKTAPVQRVAAVA